MMENDYNDKNLISLQDTNIRCSIKNHNSHNSNNPRILLNDQNIDQFILIQDFYYDKVFDTHNGKIKGSGPDWYEIEFKFPNSLNYIEMTMGIPEEDGGWWTTLNIEYESSETGEWIKINNFQIYPPYDFTNKPAGRKPFKKHIICFDRINTRKVKITGMPGGRLRYTSLSRIAFYNKRLTNHGYADVYRDFIPFIFDIIPMKKLLEFGKSIYDLTGLSMVIPFMQYYLDDKNNFDSYYPLAWNNKGTLLLDQFIYYKLGRNTWKENHDTNIINKLEKGIPFIDSLYNGIFHCIRFPIIINNNVVGEIQTKPHIIIKEKYSRDNHATMIKKYNLNREEYLKALKRTPKLSLKQFTAVKEIISVISLYIESMAREKTHIINLNKNVNNYGKQYKNKIVKQAIHLMEKYLEENITVKKLAEKLNLNRNYFSTLFKSTTGYSAKDFLINLKIERAKELLTNNNLSVINTSIILGYDQSYFSRLFKKVTGKSPSEYCNRN